MIVRGTSVARGAAGGSGGDMSLSLLSRSGDVKISTCGGVDGYSSLVPCGGVAGAVHAASGSVMIAVAREGVVKWRRRRKPLFNIAFDWSIYRHSFLLWSRDDKPRDRLGRV